ncbi:MAG: M50 family metallopeptidase [Pseudomonadota bacterium]
MDSAVIQTLIFFASLITMLGVVVVIHELGHYWAGRWFGAAVESFSVGFGNSITERKDKNGTRWRINWIPLGGFVKFIGEAQGPRDVGVVEAGPIGKPYNDLTPIQRIVVSLAGPAANFVLAVLLFTLIVWVNGTARNQIVIASVADGKPAAEAGLIPGDIVTHIDGKLIQNSRDFLIPIQLGAGDAIPLKVQRDGSEVELTVTPERRRRDNGLGQMTDLGTIDARFDPLPLEPRTYGPIGALQAGLGQTADTVDMTVNMIVRIASGRESISTLSGPVGIGDVSRRVVNRTMEVEQVPLGGRLASLGWTALQLCALISIGIGLFNLLPFPILDGGHVVFHAWEAVTGKALPEKIQEGALTVGFFLLIGLFVVVTFGDILETGVFTTAGS